MTVGDAAAVRAAFSEAVKWAGLRDKERCEATFPVFDAALDRLVAEVAEEMGAKAGKLRAALEDEVAMAEQSARKLRDLKKNWRSIIGQEVEGEPLIENILYWLIEDVEPADARAVLAGSDAPPTLSEPGDVYVVQGILTRAHNAFGDAFKGDVLEAERALARIQRSLSADAPPTPSEPEDPPCPGCGMTAQVAPSRREPGRWMCHGCAQTFDVPSANADACKNCGHSRSLHFRHNAYVPGKCDYQYDLCSCRSYEPSAQPAERET